MGISIQVHQILYTNSHVMLVLSTTVQMAAPVPEIMDNRTTL
jgi:hypothetical protein